MHRRIPIVAALVASLACGALAELPNCRAPDESIPGALDQCDKDADCVWCERNHLSFDFLCCETGKWIGPHLTNPLAFYIVWNNVPWTVILVISFEALEAVLMTFLGSFDVLFADKTDSETLASALIGDVLIQGGFGLLIGYLLRVIFLAPTLVSSPERARTYDQLGRRRIYILVYALLLLSFVLPGQMTSGGVRWGLMVNTVILLLFAWLIYPFAFSDKEDERMIWKHRNGELYEGWRKAGFFGSWGVTIILSHSSHLFTEQPVFSVNEWYQQWWLIGPWTLVLLLAAFLLSVERRDGFTAWIIVGIASTMAWFGSWFVYHITQTTNQTLVYVGAAFLIAAIIFYLIGALASWPNTQIPYSRSNDRFYAVELTRVASTTIHSNKDDDTQALVVENAAVRKEISKAGGVRKRVVPFEIDYGLHKQT